MAQKNVQKTQSHTLKVHWFCFWLADCGWVLFVCCVLFLPLNYQAKKLKSGSLRDFLCAGD